jgi:Ca2+-binding RTX toxin-like protein
MTLLINIGNRTSTYTVVDPDATIDLAKGDAINVENNNGIFQSTDVNGDAIDVEGEIHVTNGSGLRINGMGNTITAGFDSIITGNIGLWLDNGTSNTSPGGNTVVTKGQIAATADAIRNESINTSILNLGTLLADTAVVGLTFGLTLTNNELGTIDGDGRAIDLSGVSSTIQQSKIVNDGTISGDIAIFGGDEQEKITNHGTINGDVLLFGGNDLFDNRGGTINGLIDGGAGNDTYIVDKADTSMREDAAGGTGDTVESTVSFTLGVNFENLILLGSAKSDATGNAEANNIHGNQSNNILEGRGGDDLLSGGEGNDFLLGGAGSDTFVFAKKTGHDTIRDFVASGEKHDVVDLSDFSAVSNFSDLRAHNLEEHHGDVLINLGHGDVITLEHMTKADLHASDFQFVAD